MSARDRVAAAILWVAVVASGCGGLGDATLEQVGPTLRTAAADGTLVVEGRVVNAGDRVVDSALVEVIVEAADAPPVAVTVPIAEGSPLAPLLPVPFRVETGVGFDDSVRISISFLPALPEAR